MERRLGKLVMQIPQSLYRQTSLLGRAYWTDKVQSIQNIVVLWKLRAYLTSKLLFMVYNSLILPYFTFCNLILSNALESRLYKVVVLQMEAIRIIGKADYLAHTDPLFIKFGLLKIDDIGQQQISIFVYEFIKKLLPANFANYFCPKPTFILTSQGNLLVSIFHVLELM